MAHYSIHNQKYKQPDIGGIHREQFREYSEKTDYRNAVDRSKSDDNLYMALSENGTDWYKRVKEAKESTQRVTGRAVRKDAVVLCSTVESVPRTWDPDVCKEYFKDKAQWYGEYLHDKAGVDNGSMLSLVVHLDETTPHATYAWLPVKDGRLQAKNILTKQFLTSLQSDSQDFTMQWVDQYNKAHEQQLEKLEPIHSGNLTHHLSEQKYKAKVATEEAQQLQKQLSEVSQKTEKAKQEHAEISSKLSSAKEDLSRTQIETSALIHAGEDAQKKIEAASIKESSVAAREQAVEKREQNIASYVGAESFSSYQEVKMENQQLKEELTWKDKLIERLQQERDRWEENAKSWKNQAENLRRHIQNIAHKAGRKLMAAFGYDLSDSTGISDYPDRNVSQVLSDMQEQSKQYDVSSMRVIPDPNSAGTYRVAVKENGEYKTLHASFETREEAEKWRRNYQAYSKEIQLESEEIESKHMRYN